LPFKLFKTINPPFTGDNLPPYLSYKRLGLFDPYIPEITFTFNSELYLILESLQPNFHYQKLQSLY
jgi:hypothetical protein